MADVSVEFGAVDVGLEKTLKKIREEVMTLQTKVKSGELSMEDLEQTMRRVGQVESMEKRIKGMGQAASDSSPQIKNLGQQLDNAGDKAQSIGNIFDAEFAKIAGAFTVGNLAAQGFQKVFDIALNAARSVMQGFSDALDLGGRLNELSQRTGEAAGKLLVLETAFKNSGLEAAQVGTVINKLQNFMQDAANGGDKQTSVMRSLGISMSDLAGKTPTQQMQTFAERIAAIEDPTKRAAMASEVFGDKLGGKLLPLFSDFSGNLDDARGKVGSLEQVMDENAATFDAAGETIDAVKGKMMAFSAGLLSETIPAVRDLGEEMSKVDAAGLGETVGRILSPAIRSVTTDINILTSVISALLDKGRDLGSYLAGGAEQFKNISLEANKYLQILAALTPGGLNPVNLAIKGVAAASNELSGEAAIASGKLKETGTAADEAGKKMQGAGEKADTAGQSMAESFSLGADFKPQLKDLSDGWSKVGDEIAGTKPLLEGNFSLADSIAGKTDEQAQSIGGVNEQLDTTNKLNELIEGKVTETDKKLADQKAKQAASNEEKQKSLALDLQIAEALAGGNEEQAKALQYQKDFNGYLKQAQDAGMGDAAESFATAMARAAGSAKNIKEELSESAKLMKSIDDAQQKNRFDRGGKLEDKAKSQIESGDFAGARRTAAKLARQEDRVKKDDQLRGTGPNRDRRSVQDIAKDYGLGPQLGETSNQLRDRIFDARAGNTTADKFGRSIPMDADQNKSLKDELQSKPSLKDRMAEGTKSFRDRMAGKDAVEKPGQSGQPDTAAKGSDKSGGKSSLDTLVGDIKKLLEKIEPRLPVAALTA